ncbi:UNVERIFIED_CONTAM: hypothetical protein FKN15_016071 [Acipenser sinensis]
MLTVVQHTSDVTVVLAAAMLLSVKDTGSGGDAEYSGSDGAGSGNADISTGHSRRGVTALTDPLVVTNRHPRAVQDRALAVPRKEVETGADPQEVVVGAASSLPLMVKAVGLLPVVLETTATLNPVQGTLAAVY